MPEALFLLSSLSIWLITLQDVAPFIGLLVMGIAIVVIIFVIVEWYRFWVKRGMEEYKRERGYRNGEEN